MTAATTYTSISGDVNLDANAGFMGSFEEQNAENEQERRDEGRISSPSADRSSCSLLLDSMEQTHFLTQLQSSEELKQLLVRATMDLETTRSQAKLYESELCHVKNLLKSARQERDEAREAVMKLRESFFSANCVSNALTSVFRAPAAETPTTTAYTYSTHRKLRRRPGNTICTWTAFLAPSC